MGFFCGKDCCFSCLQNRLERQLWHGMMTEQHKDEQLGFDFEVVVEVGELF